MSLSLHEFQARITEIFGEKDAARGLAWSFAWLVEEVGELGAALRNWETLEHGGRVESPKAGGPDAVRRNLREEFADVLAWLSTLAEMTGVDLAEVAYERYGTGCPYCRSSPCRCNAEADRASAPGRE